MTTTYCTLAEVSDMLGIRDSQDDIHLATSIEAACRWIDKLCGRRFYIDGTTPADVTARVFYPTNEYCVKVDDFASATNLVVKTDAGDDLTYESTWAIATDFELHPLNQLGPAGQAWCYNEIVAVGGRYFPATRRACVQVTARWGWPAVPADIKLAALQLASFCFKNKEAPLGIAAFTDLGALRARTPSIVLDLLAGYEKETAYGAPMVG